MKEAQVTSSCRDEVKQVIQNPEEVQAMLLLASRGWGTKRLAREFGCSRNTVKRYVKQGKWQAYGGKGRVKKLDGLDDWLVESFKQHRGNADVVRQDIERVHGLKVSLRTVERAVERLRQDLRIEALATVRFETPPGKQMQIDFGERFVKIGGVATKVFLFVATLGHSRRIYAEAFLNERCCSWFAGMEGAFRHFGGTTAEVLLDNGPLVKRHDRLTREVTFNERFLAFCKHWSIIPRACAPYRARTKGKDERGVGYVKNNAIAGREFDSMEGLNAHLVQWTREISDLRVHGTTGESPILRFERDEAKLLRPLDGRAPFVQLREVLRIVANDAFVDLDTNRYSVPWQLIGQNVLLTASDQRVTVVHQGKVIADHPQSFGHHQRIQDSSHFKGIFKSQPVETPALEKPELLRSLDVYEIAVGGGF